MEMGEKQRLLNSFCYLSDDLHLLYVYVPVKVAGNTFPQFLRLSPSTACLLCLRCLSDSSMMNASLDPVLVWAKTNILTVPPPSPPPPPPPPAPPPPPPPSPPAPPKWVTSKLGSSFVTLDLFSCMEKKRQIIRTFLRLASNVIFSPQVVSLVQLQEEALGQAAVETCGQIQIRSV